MVQVFVRKVKGIDAAVLESAVTPILTAHGVQTAELSHQLEQGGWVLRVTVEELEEGRGVLPVAVPQPGADPQAAGIDLGLLTEISRDLSTALDVADVIPHRYTLEVSSPGLERPLRALRDFQRAIGSLVKVYLAKPAADGQRVLRGRLAAADEPAGGTVTVEVDGKPVSAALADISRAHTLYELPAQPKRNRASSKNQRH